MATTVEHMPPEAAATPQPTAPEGAAQQPAPSAPPDRDKPREPLSAGAVASIAVVLIGALLTVCGVASVAAFNALRDDIGELRAETKAGDEALRDDMTVLEESLRSDMAAIEQSLRSEIGDLRAEVGNLRAEMTSADESLRAELREFRAEFNKVALDHTQRLARLEAAHPHPADR